MDVKKIVMFGLISGLVFGIALFLGGAITARIVYGPHMAPEGKFEQEQMNAFYFVWTKLVIGVVFGTLFLFLYEKLPLSAKINSILGGLKYGFLFWLIISLWNLSHPFVYGSIMNSDRLFWLVYTLWGFLGYGGAIGYLYKRMSKA